MGKIKTGISTDVEFRKALTDKGASLRIDSTPEELLTAFTETGSFVSYLSPNEVVVEAVNSEVEPEIDYEHNAVVKLHVVDTTGKDDEEYYGTVGFDNDTVVVDSDEGTDFYIVSDSEIDLTRKNISLNTTYPTNTDLVVPDGKTTLAVGETIDVNLTIDMRKYSIVYHSNGSSTEDFTTEAYPYGDEVELKAGTDFVAPEGTTFGGWYKDLNDDESLVTSPYTIAYDDNDLYAKWIPEV